jgi:hypothetical protein
MDDALAAPSTSTPQSHTPSHSSRPPRIIEMRLSDLSDDDLDSLLLAAVTAKWQKVAMVISKAVGAYETWDESRLTRRILALIEAGTLESAGDVNNWRFSEVRTKR